MSALSPAMLSLLDVLAEIEVRNYLHPQASHDNDPAAERPDHPVSEADREAA
ncbi:MAG TPA: hypothetical protein VIG97_14435 [Luteimonas sp.]